MVTVEITAGEFYNDYKMIQDKFSYAGAMALFEYIEEYTESRNEPINPNDWAIEWTEFKSKDEAVSDLGFDSWGKLDEDRATYEFEGGVLVADYKAVKH